MLRRVVEPLPGKYQIFLASARKLVPPTWYAWAVVTLSLVALVGARLLTLPKSLRFGSQISRCRVSGCETYSMTSPGRPACREYGRIFLCGDAFERCFNLIDSLRQIRAAERLKRVNCFCNCNLRFDSLSMACRQLYRTSRSMAHTAIFPRFDPEHNGTWSTVHFATGQPTEFFGRDPPENCR
jgi:hypothetical protein